MDNQRMPLPPGTVVTFPRGGSYLLSDLIGQGGESLIYRASREGDTDGILYALKECYPPSSEDLTFYRAASGEIIAGEGEEFAAAKGVNQSEALFQAMKKQFLDETYISQAIYREASRTLPTREASREVFLTLPGKEPVKVPNTCTVMDSIAAKGRPLSDVMTKRRRMELRDSVTLIQQLLFALEEVHRAGYIHLDIQPGNVFLAGSLSDGSASLSLIDFGCARKLAEDGKTEEITNRLIFTTPGFTAPEILTENDGTLRLGPEADLYSAGCLFMFLLTGSRFTQRSLLFLPEKPLTNSDLRFIHCPQNLLDDLQAILHRALMAKSEDRYHSAEAMLNDVTKLLEALKVDDSTGLHYDAFLTYKHGSRDSRAAKVMQELLEGYRNREGEDTRPIKRVFVDEGELSSGPYFGDQINTALRNSDWLIVLCSEKTPQSQWVSREIAYFLQHHDRSHVLAVLLDGSRSTSFPPELFGNTPEEEVLAMEAQGKSERAVLRNLRRDAVYGILAPMLGTNYEALKQRQKLRRMKRIAAISAGFLALALGFSVYAFNRAQIIAGQRDRIEEEYHRALLQEGRYLAEQALREYERGDMASAARMAMRALPSPEQPDRPANALAQQVLENTLGVYVQDGVPHFETAAAYSHKGDLIEDPFLEGSLLFSCAGSGGKEDLYIWDTARDRAACVLPLGEEQIRVFREELLDPEEKLLYYITYSPITYYRLHCFDYEQMEERWVIEAEVKAAAPLPGQGIVFITQNWEIFLADAATGEYTLLKDVSSELSTEDLYLGNDAVLSADGRYFAFFPFCWGFSASGLDICSAAVFDLEEKTLLTCGEELENLSHAVFTSENRLLTLDYRSDALSIQVDSINAAPGELFPETLRSIDVQTGQLLWEKECGGVGFTARDTLKVGFSEGKEIILLSTNDRVYLLDPESGEELYALEMPSQILAADLQGDLESGTVAVLCRDGRFYTAALSDDSRLGISVFRNEIHSCIRSEGIFFAVLEDSPREILKSRMPEQQNRVTVREDDGLYFEYASVDDGSLFLVGRQYRHPVLFLYSTETDEGKTIDLTALWDEDTSWECVDSRMEDGKAVLIMRDEYWDHSCWLLQIDPETGSTEKEPWEEPEKPPLWSAESGLIRILGENGTVQCEIPLEDASGVVGCVPVGNGERFAFAFANGTLGVYRRNGEQLFLSEDFLTVTDNAEAAFLDEDTLAFLISSVYRHGIVILDVSEELCGVRSVIDGGIAVDPVQRKVYVSNDGYGYLPLRSIPELIEMAEERFGS